MNDDCKTIPDYVLENVLDIDFWRKFAPKFTIMVSMVRAGKTFQKQAFRMCAPCLARPVM